jgi:N-acetylglutamate synthase-like GNAT family acetyltransferase
MSEVKLRRAGAADAAAIAACVRQAYARYADRLPYPPKPVLADYRVVVRETSTWLLEDADGQCVGVVVLIEKPDHVLLDNVAVDPASQKRGLGRRLLEFAEAEARRLGLGEVRL